MGEFSEMESCEAEEEVRWCREEWCVEEFSEMESCEAEEVVRMGRGAGVASAMS